MVKLGQEVLEHADFLDVMPQPSFALRFRKGECVNEWPDEGIPGRSSADDEAILIKRAAGFGLERVFHAGQSLSPMQLGIVDVTTFIEPFYMRDGVDYCRYGPSEMRLETKRLILRPWEERDRVPMALIQSDPEVRRYYPSVLTQEQSDIQITEWLECAQINGFHFQAAELKEDGRLVGLIGLGAIPEDTRALIRGAPQVEIGWILGRNFWGRGLASEGAQAWLYYAWTIGLPEVVAFTARINLPSQRVMEKLGMRHEAADVFDYPSLQEGHPLRPHVVYRIQNPETTSTATA